MKNDVTLLNPVQKSGGGRCFYASNLILIECLELQQKFDGFGANKKVKNIQS